MVQTCVKSLDLHSHRASEEESGVSLGTRRELVVPQRLIGLSCVKLTALAK